MTWLKRVKEGILTSTNEKVGLPEGIWDKCPVCKNAITVKELEKNSYVCSCEHNHHFRIGSDKYFQILFDTKKYQELFSEIQASDPLDFKDRKSYKDRIEEAKQKSNLDEAMKVAHGKINKMDMVVAAMDFAYIGGSMGSVVGEKISKAIDYCRENYFPLVIISKSGGARMMESTYSLMQMAKTSTKLALLERDQIPYISVMTDPTTGGVTASFAMLGDFNIAEPNALIGFAGPRVIKQTTGKDLPEGFQKSEFLLEHGFLDFITDRRSLKSKISTLVKLTMEDKFRKSRKRNSKKNKPQSPPASNGQRKSSRKAGAQAKQ